MSGFFDGFLKAGGFLIEEIAKASQQQLHEMSPIPNWDANFEHAIPALNEKCVEWQRLSPTAFRGEFENRGDSASVNMYCIPGKVALVCCDPIQMPVYLLNQKLAAYMLLRSGMSFNGAWTAREKDSELELRYFIRIPLKIADCESLGEAIMFSALETIKLQKILDC